MKSESRERFLDANGLRFHALEWDGREPTALFVHATSLCADGWRPVVETMNDAAAPRRCIAFDQRGHGRSDAPADPAAYEWTRLADDAAALASVVAQGGAKVVGVGHSSGATALLAAAGQHPECFGALVAVEPVLFEKPDGSGADSFAGSSHLANSARRRRDRFASIVDACERLRSKPPFANFDTAAFDDVLHGMLASDGDGVALRCPGEREAWCYDGAVALDAWPLFARIRVPLLLVLGEHSAVAPSLRDRLVAAVPSVQIATIPEARTSRRWSARANSAPRSRAFSPASRDHALVRDPRRGGLARCGAESAMRRRVAAALAAARDAPDARFLPTGGVGRNPPSEASAMRRLLCEAGIAFERITLEEQGTDTLSSVVACARILADAGAVASITVCTDAYHVARTRAVFRALGVRTVAAPAYGAATALGARRYAWAIAREALGLPWDVALAIAQRSGR